MPIQGPNKDFLISQLGLSNLVIKDYTAQENSLSTGINDDRSPIVIPEVDQFSITPGQKSLLGTLVFSDLRISYGETSIYLDTVVFDIHQPKKIVSTGLPGRDGEVLEYISLGNYVINIRIALVSPDRSYPEDQVRVMRTLLNTPDALEVVSPLLNLFEIYNIAVQDYTIPSVDGKINTQMVEINCLSDSPIELTNDDQTIG